MIWLDLFDKTILVLPSGGNYPSRIRPTHKHTRAAPHGQQSVNALVVLTAAGREDATVRLVSTSQHELNQVKRKNIRFRYFVIQIKSYDRILEASMKLFTVTVMSVIIPRGTLKLINNNLIGSYRQPHVRILTTCKIFHNLIQN